METQAVVEEGGLVRIEGVPFDPGTRIDVKMTVRRPEMIQEEWAAFLERHYGALANTDFDVPEDSPPSEIEPL